MKRSAWGSGTDCLSSPKPLAASQRLYRSLIVEDAAKSLVVAAVVRKPQLFTEAHEEDIMAQGGSHHRIRMMEEG